MSTSWVTRWGYEMANKPSRPGVYRLKNGGFFVRAKHGTRALPEASLAEAQAVRLELSAPKVQTSRPFFADFAVSLFEERVLKGKIQSPSTRERWDGTLKHYLIPEFGLKRVDEIEPADIINWTNDLARWIRAGKKPSLKDPEKTVTFKATTANGLLRILRTIMTAAMDRYYLRNAFAGVDFFPEGRIYDAENPNSLSPDHVRQFLQIAKEKYPQHYAFMVLGFVTGLRPSSLRALRRNIDVIWMKNQILVRRSNSRGQQIMNKTKTGHDQVIALPQEMMEILREHVQSLTGAMKASEYLFPSDPDYSRKDGKVGMRSRSCLDKPFKAIVKKMKLDFTVTPRAMRRSFQDLARKAEVEAIVTRSISGHRTEKMQEHYSTVRQDEQQEGIGRLLRLVK